MARSKTLSAIRRAATKRKRAAPPDEQHPAPAVAHWLFGPSHALAMRGILECGQSTTVLLLARFLNVDKHLVSYIVSDLKTARLVTENNHAISAVCLQRVDQAIQGLSCTDLEQSVSAYAKATSFKRARVPSLGS